VLLQLENLLLSVGFSLADGLKEEIGRFVDQKNNIRMCFHCDTGIDDLSHTIITFTHPTQLSHQCLVTGKVLRWKKFWNATVCQESIEKSKLDPSVTDLSAEHSDSKACGIWITHGDWAVCYVASLFYFLCLYVRIFVECRILMSF